jgi:proteasome accessory factor A
VIIGDANLSETQIFLKLGSAALILSAIEDGALPEAVGFEDPVKEVWSVSHDPSLAYRMTRDDGSTLTALEAQWQYLEWATKYARAADLHPAYERVLREWEEILTDLERDPKLTADRLDWTAKLDILDGYRARDGLAWDDAKLRLLGLQYHDVNPDKGLYHRLVARGRIERLVDDEAIAKAVVHAPESTRAYFRGECVARYGGSLVAANWDSLVFDTGEETLKRVPMMEPLRGTKERVGGLLDRSPDAAALIRALGGD